MKRLLVILYFMFNAAYGYCQHTDTFQVHFAFNESKLSKQAEDQIDQLIFKDALIHGQKLIVLGYADYVGDTGYNNKLSSLRAKNVQNYLVASGFDEKDIKICIGKGKIERTDIKGNEGYQPDRKVEIIIDRSQAGNLKNKVDSGFLSSSSIKVNETYRLNILFEKASSVFAKNSDLQLEYLYKFMNDNKTVSVQIEGHICCIWPRTSGDGEDKNGGGPLSWKRAKAVYTYLVDRGIKAERVKYQGFGGSRPLIKYERTEEDRLNNRRVEIRILSK